VSSASARPAAEPTFPSEWPSGKSMRPEAVLQGVNYISVRMVGHSYKAEDNYLA
jgi:hypothetical protein